MSDHTKALAFTIPGKSAKQLEEWCKQYRYAEWQAAVAAGARDRYTFVQIVEAAQREMREEEDGQMVDDGESQASADSKKPKRKVSRHGVAHQSLCGNGCVPLLTFIAWCVVRLCRSQSRISLGYDGGKPEPASPRVKAKRTSTAGAKRKSRGSSAKVEEQQQQDETKEQEDADDDEDAVSEISTPPQKRSRTGKATSHATKGRAASSAAAPTSKGKGSKHQKHDDAMEDDDHSHAEDSHAASEDSEMSEARPADRAKTSKDKTASKATPYVDPSLFASMGHPPASAAAAGAHSPPVTIEDDEDIEMRVSPPASTIPVVPNAFQHSPIQPSAPPAEEEDIGKYFRRSPQPQQASRKSIQHLTTGVPTPFTQARHSGSFGSNQTQQPQHAAHTPVTAAPKFQPFHSSPLGSFAPTFSTQPRDYSASGRPGKEDQYEKEQQKGDKMAGFRFPEPSARDAEVEEEEDDKYSRQFHVPSYIPTPQHRHQNAPVEQSTLFGAAAREELYIRVSRNNRPRSPFDEGLRHRFSTSNTAAAASSPTPTTELKYPSAWKPLAPSQDAHSMEEEKYSVSRRGAAGHARRFSDRVKGLVGLGEDGQEELPDTLVETEAWVGCPL